jgi:hypothetical protein
MAESTPSNESERTMRLRGTDVDRYLSRDLDERRLSAMDARVSTSLSLTELLAQQAMEEVGWERRGLLGRLVRVGRPSEARPAPAIQEQAKAA